MVVRHGLSGGEPFYVFHAVDARHDNPDGVTVVWRERFPVPLPRKQRRRRQGLVQRQAVRVAVGRLEANVRHAGLPPGTLERRAQGEAPPGRFFGEPRHEPTKAFLPKLLQH